VYLADTNQLKAQHPLGRPNETAELSQTTIESGPYSDQPQSELETADSAALRYEDISLMLRYTRRWIHYGMIAHIVICTLIAAIEGVLFRLF
jgi:hypothetical protein